MSDYQRWYDSLSPSTQMLIDRKYGEIVWRAAIEFARTPRFIATFRYRDADTDASICSAVLREDPETIRYGYDLVSKQQIVLDENEFFDSVLPKLIHTVPFEVKTKNFLMNRTISLLHEKNNQPQ